VEVPHLAKWAQRYKRQGLVVIGLSMASPKEQREAAQRFGITYPLFLWEREKLPSLLRRITATPTTLLLDRKGRIVEVQVGLLFGERLAAWERKIRALLQERPANAQR
jgi:peroxiredoxin